LVVSGLRGAVQQRIHRQMLILRLGAQPTLKQGPSRPSFCPLHSRIRFDPHETRMVAVARLSQIIETAKHGHRDKQWRDEELPAVTGEPHISEGNNLISIVSGLHYRSLICLLTACIFRTEHRRISIRHGEGNERRRGRHSQIGQVGC
jgi:hypothetical protein